MPIDTRDERLERRIANLLATDPQFAAASPDDAISAAVERPELRLPDLVETVFDGYAKRPALGARAVELRTDPDTGRTSVELLPRFDTISYAELSDRVNAITSALTGDRVRPGDRVALLGFTSVDYTCVDIALIGLGAVSVPLQTSAPVGQLRPIISETEPTVIASSVDYLGDAVELVLTGFAPARLIVFDYLPAVDDHRDALGAAKARLAQAGSPVVVETLADVIERGARLPAVTPFIADDPDPLTLLVYTSGSTGTPKGAMYPERLVANSWRRSVRGTWGDEGVHPSITLSFMPMSHMMGRGMLYGTLGAGGTVYFAAKSDLSTFLDDLALVRPTQLNFVPRVWEMLSAEVYSEMDRRSPNGADPAVLNDVRTRLLGNRYLTAVTGSAPLSSDLKAWVESFLDLHLVDGYGSTEAGGVFLDGQVRRPPVID